MSNSLPAKFHGATLAAILFLMAVAPLASSQNNR